MNQTEDNAVAQVPQYLYTERGEKNQELICKSYNRMRGEMSSPATKCAGMHDAFLRRCSSSILKRRFAVYR